MAKETTTAAGMNVAETETSHSKTIEITMAALFIALTYVATAFINVRIPFLAANGGLIHLGNIPLFVAAAIYGKRTGALAGAFGMGLFDLTSGWVSWAPFTFVICGLIGFAFAAVAGKKAGKGRLILAVFVAVYPFCCFFAYRRMDLFFSRFGKSKTFNDWTKRIFTR